MHEQKRALAVYSHALCMLSFHPLLCMQNFPQSVCPDTLALCDITVGTGASAYGFSSLCSILFMTHSIEVQGALMHQS